MVNAAVVAAAVSRNLRRFWSFVICPSLAKHQEHHTAEAEVEAMLESGAGHRFLRNIARVFYLWQGWYPGVRVVIRLAIGVSDSRFSIGGRLSICPTSVCCAIAPFLYHPALQPGVIFPWPACSRATQTTKGDRLRHRLVYNTFGLSLEQGDYFHAWSVTNSDDSRRRLPGCRRSDCDAAISIASRFQTHARSAGHAEGVDE